MRNQPPGLAPYAAPRDKNLPSFDGFSSPDLRLGSTTVTIKKLLRKKLVSADLLLPWSAWSTHLHVHAQHGGERGAAAFIIAMADQAIARGGRIFFIDPCTDVDKASSSLYEMAMQHYRECHVIAESEDIEHISTAADPDNVLAEGENVCFTKGAAARLVSDHGMNLVAQLVSTTPYNGKHESRNVKSLPNMLIMRNVDTESIAHFASMVRGMGGSIVVLTQGEERLGPATSANLRWQVMVSPDKTGDEKQFIGAIQPRGMHVGDDAVPSMDFLIP